MDEQVDRRQVEIDRAMPRARRRGWGWLWTLLTLAVVGAGGWYGWQLYSAPAAGPQGGAAPAGRSGQSPPQPVGVAAAQRGDVRILVNGLGTVAPLATVTVKTQLAGQLQQIGFTEGQLVHKGDFLAQIDPRPYQAALEQYQGQLAKDQALLKQAQVDLTRYQTLLKQDSIARQQADDQVYLVQQDEGAIRTDQAQIDAQKLNLVYCHIVAPVDGRVGLRQVDVGNYVQTSDANGIVVITQLQPISVLFAIPEDNLAMVLKRFHAGGKLPVTAFDRANATPLATGELSTMDNQIDTTTGTVKLRATFANTDESLFPNQFVNAQLLVDTLHDVVTVPVAAVQRGAPGNYVYVVGADSTVSVRPVKIGITDGDKVQVRSGLAEGERVVIDGADRLRGGVHVTVMEAAAPAKGGGQADGGEAAAHQHRHQQQQQPPQGSQ